VRKQGESAVSDKDIIDGGNNGGHTGPVVERTVAPAGLIDATPATENFRRFYTGAMILVAIAVTVIAGWSIRYVLNYGFLPFEMAETIDRIRYGEREVALAALVDLSGDERKARRAVSALTGIVADPDAGNRDLAAELLGQIGPAARKAVPVLSEALLDDDAELRLAAIDALGGIGVAAEPAVPLLSELLATGDEVTRERAANALGGIGYAAANADDALFAALDDPSGRVRAHALLALAQTGAEPPADALPKMAGLLENPDPEIRAAAARTIGLLHEDLQSLAPDLTMALGDVDARVREQAARALGMIGEAAAPALAALTARFDDAEAKVRIQAVWAVGQMGEAAARATPELVAALEDSDEEVQRQAYEALKQVVRNSDDELPDVAAALDKHPLHESSDGHHGENKKTEPYAHENEAVPENG
jgi:HEAT repeat protein